MPVFQPPVYLHELLDAVPRKLLDVPYGHESIAGDQILDIYWPSKGEGPFPVIVYFHGGGFAYGSKLSDRMEPALRGVQRGYVVVSAEYRKSSEARFPAMLYDGKLVIRFLRAHAKEWNLDAGRIAVWGPSAGGWMAAMLGVTNGNSAFENPEQGYAEYSSDVQAVIDWCGPASFLTMEQRAMEKAKAEGIPYESDHAAARFLGAPIHLVKELARLASPITHVPQSCVPFLIMHGTGDEVVPWEESRDLAQKIIQIAGEGRAELHLVEGKPHHAQFSWYREPSISELCFDFLQRHL